VRKWDDMVFLIADLILGWIRSSDNGCWRMSNRGISLPTHQIPRRSHVFLEQSLALSVRFTICRE
jgi:hypothetical protein